jgi:hypothetical protein
VIVNGRSAASRIAKDGRSPCGSRFGVSRPAGRAALGRHGCA